MRRLVVLLVLSLFGATLYGLSNTSSGISVNGTALSNSDFRSELSAISTNLNLQCYVAALNPVNYAPGAGGATIAATGAAAWANLRVEGIAIEQYVATTLNFHPSAAVLAQAKTSLEGELTQSALSRHYRCPSSSSAALASMPSEMRDFEIHAQAASLMMLSRLNSTVPLTSASMQMYYASHATNYDTICVSVAIVAPTTVTAFDAARARGLSVAALAKKFSLAPSRSNGGAYGCFDPSSSSYISVRADTVTTPLNTFAKTPQFFANNNQEYALFVAPTKRTATPFARAQASILTDLQSLNANSANTVKQNILYRAAVAVDPAFGRWGLNTTGPTVFAPATPASALVGTNLTLRALSSASRATYK